jgi:hypothetical protein
MIVPLERRKRQIPVPFLIPLYSDTVSSKAPAQRNLAPPQPQRKAAKAPRRRNALAKASNPASDGDQNPAGDGDQALPPQKDPVNSGHDYLDLIDSGHDEYDEENGHIDGGELTYNGTSQSCNHGLTQMPALRRQPPQQLVPLNSRPSLRRTTFKILPAPMI